MFKGHNIKYKYSLFSIYTTTVLYYIYRLKNNNISTVALNELTLSIFVLKNSMFHYFACL